MKRSAEMPCACALAFRAAAMSSGIFDVYVHGVLPLRSLSIKKMNGFFTFYRNHYCLQEVC